MAILYRRRGTLSNIRGGGGGRQVPTIARSAVFYSIEITAMSDHTPCERIDELLAELAWTRRLARALVSDGADADDLVQETWLTALQSPPQSSASPRGWLRSVMTSRAINRARGAARREARDRSFAGESVPTPEELVERARLREMLARHVLRLDEPYRTTILLRFGEGKSAAEIARAQGLPSATVRWRLHEAVERLRTDLDADFGGGRSAWMLALAPLWGPSSAAAGGDSSGSTWTRVATFAAGAISMNTRAKVGGGLALVALISLVAGSVMAARGCAHAPRGLALAASPGPLPIEVTPRLRLPSLTSLTPQLDAASRVVAGVVLDDGRPLSGADVVLVGALSSGGPDSPHEARRSGVGGRFDFGLMPPAVYTVFATAPGRGPAWVDIDTRDPAATPPPDQLRLLLFPCGGTLTGRVLEGSGGAVPSARIEVGEAFGRGLGWFSDEEGRFSLCLPRGRVPLTVAASGYGSLAVTPVVLGSMRADFALAPEATLAGQVVQEGSETPVAGARVVIQPSETGDQRAARQIAFTDEYGHFRVAQLAAGRLIVSASAEGLESPSPFQVNAVPTRAVPEVTVRLRSVARLRGVVVHEGAPVVGADVVVGGFGSGSEHVRTQSDGRFALTRVPRGQLRFCVEGYDVNSPALVEAGRVDQVQVEVTPMAAIVGRVTLEGHPVERARLTDPWERSIYTDVDGRFTMRGVFPGPYVVYAKSDRLGADGRTSVDVDGPAARAGLRAGDQIVEVAGAAVDDLGSESIGALITNAAPRPVPIGVVRGDRSRATLLVAF